MESLFLRGYYSDDNLSDLVGTNVAMTPRTIQKQMDELEQHRPPHWSEVDLPNEDDGCPECGCKNWDCIPFSMVNQCVDCGHMFLDRNIDQN